MAPAEKNGVSPGTFKLPLTGGSFSYTILRSRCAKGGSQIMRTGAFQEAQPVEPFLRRLRRQWWVFLVPLYPVVWVWVGAFLLALFISQPLQWKQLNAANNSYVIVQVHPYSAWPAKEPFGSFTGAALTRNLSGFLEAADLQEFWFVPVHLQIARRLADQSPGVPPSAFVRAARGVD